MSINQSTQTGRPLEVVTPLGKDALLLCSLTGREGLSQMFEFTLDVLADNRRDVPFEMLLGQPIVVCLELPGQNQRFFHGMCNQVSQGESDQHFTAYTLTVVPRLWVLTRKTQCRIFQQLTVPDILKEVLTGLDVAFQLQGAFPPRNYCVQYRETDFNFVSRLMEEEGIYYFFRHTDEGHQMVLANAPWSHPDLEPAQAIYQSIQGDNHVADRIYDWQKTQALCSGKYTLYDHCFELPHKHLEAQKRIPDSVPVGRAVHKLLVDGNDKLEIFNYPGEYAQRFDGIHPDGAERPKELTRIFEDNMRTVAIRMEQEAAAGLAIRGASSCRHLASGHKMTVATLPDDTLARMLKMEGSYVLTEVVHRATQGAYRSGGHGHSEWSYFNSFTCIPFAQPFRPQRVTPKPAIQGTQTAVVVCSPGEEIEPDKYGRVKIKFHWDRRPANDLSSSCWVRVGTPWAGKQWGMIHIPRVGQEVLVDFLEGDPDRPIIIGSVYNAGNMPPYKLPENKTMSGVKSRSSPNGAAGNFNEIRFEDKKGNELLTVHAERDMATSVEVDNALTVGNNHSVDIGEDPNADPHQSGKSTTTTFGDTKLTITKGDYSAHVAEGKADIHVTGPVTEDFGNTQSTTVSKGIDVTSTTAHIHLKAETEIVLTVGQSQLTITQNSITLKSAEITAAADGTHNIQGALVKIN